MKCIIKILWLFCFCAMGVLAQETEQVRIRKFVEVPREVILQVVAVQPNCPVKFEDIHFLASLEGGGSNSYRLRNIGTKPIRSVKVASSNGVGNGYANYGNVLMMPGELMPEPTPVCPGCVKDEIVPLTDELREKLKLKGPMGNVIILIVVEVEFMDGTKYTDERTYNAMTKLWEKLDNALDALKEKEQRAAKQP